MPTSTRPARSTSRSSRQLWGAPVLAGAALLLCPACGSHADEGKVASVAGKPIPRERLEQAVEHFQEEAKRERKTFPAEDSPAFRAAERRLVRLLVYRKELELAAKRLGVRADDGAVEERLAGTAAAEGETGSGERDKNGFLEDTARSQLLYEGIYRRVTASVAVSRADVARSRGSRSGQAPAVVRAELLQAKRNALMRAWVRRMMARYKPTVRISRELEARG